MRKFLFSASVNDKRKPWLYCLLLNAVSESNEKHQQLTVSEQGYSLSLPNEYTLQKEEDGKDILFSTKTSIRGCD